MKLEPPTFTIGQVWFDFVKRLPRTRPRYKDTRSDYNPYLQASADQLAALASLQAQYGPAQYAALQAQQMNLNPYNGNPIGCGIGWPFGRF